MLSLAVAVALGQPEIYHEDRVLGRLSTADQEVIRFYVSVNDALLVHFLYKLDELDRYEEACLQVEAALARRKKVFE